MNSRCSMEMTGRARGKPSLNLLGWGVPVPAQLQEKSAGPVVTLLGLQCLPWVLCVSSPAVLSQRGSSRPLKLFLLLLLPFPDCDCPWRIPTLTSPTHGVCSVPWATTELQLPAGLSQASPLGGFPGGAASQRASLRYA